MQPSESNNQLTFTLAVLLLVVVACACPNTNDNRRYSNINSSNTSPISTPASVEPKVSTSTPNKPARIEWEYVGKYPLVQYEGHPFYQLSDGFFAEIPNYGNMDSRIRVFVPEQYRVNGQTAATAAASVTCNIERYVGSKVIELYDGNVIGYQFELKSGTNLLVVPGSRLLKTAILVQTLPGREPIIGIAEVQP